MIRKFRNPETPSGCCSLSVFKNVGATCFLNSVLQCLMHIPRLTDIIRIRYDELRHRVETTCREEGSPDEVSNRTLGIVLLHTIIESIIEQSCIDPDYLIKLLCDKAAFRRGQQQDAHECLNWLLDSIHSSVEKTKLPRESVEPCSLDPEMLLECSSKSHPKEKSFINDGLFSCLTNSRKACLISMVRDGTIPTSPFRFTPRTTAGMRRSQCQHLLATSSYLPSTTVRSQGC